VNVAQLLLFFLCSTLSLPPSLPPSLPSSLPPSPLSKILPSLPSLAFIHVSSDPSLSLVLLSFLLSLSSIMDTNSQAPAPPQFCTSSLPPSLVCVCVCVCGRIVVKLYISTHTFAPTYMHTDTHIPTHTHAHVYGQYPEIPRSSTEDNANVDGESIVFLSSPTRQMKLAESMYVVCVCVCINPSICCICMYQSIYLLYM